MNYIDEKIEEFQCMNATKIFYECVDNTEQVEMLKAAQSDFIRTALQEAHTKGTQEALAKVEEWVQDNLYEDVALATDLLHHLQQLKDNKTV